jgi:hypothetical protein
MCSYHETLENEWSSYLLVLASTKTSAVPQPLHQSPVSSSTGFAQRMLPSIPHAQSSDQGNPHVGPDASSLSFPAIMLSRKGSGDKSVAKSGDKSVMKQAHVSKPGYQVDIGSPSHFVSKLPSLNGHNKPVKLKLAIRQMDECF